jgi:hypothetical protein
MRWYKRKAFDRGLRGDVVSVEAARQILRNRRHAADSQYDLYTQGRATISAVRGALANLESALRDAREVLQTGHGTATIDQWAGLQDMYRRSEYTFNEVTRLLEEAETPAAPPGTPRPPPGTTPPAGTGGKQPAPTTEGEGGGTLASITSHPAFFPAVLGVGAVGAVLLLTGKKGK